MIKSYTPLFSWWGRTRGAGVVRSRSSVAGNGISQMPCEHHIRKRAEERVFVEVVWCQSWIMLADRKTVDLPPCASWGAGRIIRRYYRGVACMDQATHTSWFTWRVRLNIWNNLATWSPYYRYIITYIYARFTNEHIDGTFWSQVNSTFACRCVPNSGFIKPTAQPRSTYMPLS